MEAGTRVRREVVSFVRRSARMNPSQRRAYELYGERFMIDVPRSAASTSVDPATAPLDLVKLFGRPGPLVVEIGPGTGDSLATMAAARPEANVLAFEVFEPAVGSLLAKVGATGTTNVRIVLADAVAGLSTLLGPGSVDELWTFFPDPWPKPRHHKRRLVSGVFAELVATRLRPGGRWWLATDWPAYAEHIMAVLDRHPAFVADERPLLPARPRTRFERRGSEAGRPIADLAYRRVSRSQ